MFALIDDDVFPNVNKLYHIRVLTIPQTSVNVERLFSSVKQIKTRLRSRMTTDRLSALSLLTFERDLSKKLEKDYILLKFKHMKKRRLL